MSAAELAARLAGSAEPWSTVLPVVAASADVDAMVVVVATPHGYERLAAFGVLPADVAAAPNVVEAESRLRRAGFVGVWLHAVRGGGFIAAARRGSDLTLEERVWLAAMAPVLELGARASADAAVRQREAEQRKLLEDRVELLERQSTVGAVAAAVAHDLAAPVSALLMEGSEIRKRVLELSTMVPQAGPALRNVIEDLRGLGDHVLEAAERARYLLTDFRLSARSGAEVGAASGAVAIGDTLRACVRLVRPLAGQRVQLELSVEAGLPAIPGARRRLEQAFTNLLVNAIHAAQVREGRAGTVRVRAIADQGAVLVEVTDNGAGIPPELKKRIFEPFFSTKPAELGTGLGLPIAQEIVLAHGGTLDVDSERGRGATFRVRLPVEPSARKSRRSPRVLVVHPDPEMAVTLRRALAGYEVTAAESADRAVDLLGQGATFDAIIADLAAPDPEGPVLFARIRRRWPGLERKIIFAGAGAHTAASAAFLSSVPNRRFETPIAAEELRPIVESVVDAA